MTIRCLLWDFGDTLCDERSLWRAGPEWMEVYRSFEEEDSLGMAWERGNLDTRAFAARLAERMSSSALEIEAHLSRTDVFEFFPFTYAFFRARHRPQAVVTVNPTAFRELARAFAFEEVTETVVISAEERILDKGALCEIALGRMSLDCAPAEALLIDNKRANVQAWEARGGVGYVYTTDADFERDAAGGVDGLIAR